MQFLGGVRVIGMIYYHSLKKVVNLFCLQVRISGFVMVTSEAGIYTSSFHSAETDIQVSWANLDTNM